MLCPVLNMYLLLLQMSFLNFISCVMILDSVYYVQAKRSSRLKETASSTESTRAASPISGSSGEPSNTGSPHDQSHSRSCSPLLFTSGEEEEEGDHCWRGSSKFQLILFFNMYTFWSNINGFQWNKFMRKWSHLNQQVNFLKLKHF